MAAVIFAWFIGAEGKREGGREGQWSAAGQEDGFLRAGRLFRLTGLPCTRGCYAGVHGFLFLDTDGPEHGSITAIRDWGRGTDMGVLVFCSSFWLPEGWVWGRGRQAGHFLVEGIEPKSDQVSVVHFLEKAMIKAALI